MLGHFDPGFTLRTYTHVTRQMQESAAEKMGNFMAQMMEKQKSGGEDQTNILSAALWTFRRVGHGVGQGGFHRFSRSAFPKMVYTFIYRKNSAGLMPEKHHFSTKSEIRK